MQVILQNMLNFFRYDKEKLEELIGYVKGIDFKYYIRSHEGIWTREEAMKFLAERLKNV